MHKKDKEALDAGGQAQEGLSEKVEEKKEEKKPQEINLITEDVGGMTIEGSRDFKLTFDKGHGMSALGMDTGDELRVRGDDIESPEFQL